MKKKIFIGFLILVFAILFGFYLLLSEKYYSSEPEHDISQVLSQNIEVNGLSVRYLMVGEKDNPHLIFLHGWGGNYQSEKLERITAAFADQGYFAITPELPGMGQSDRLSTSWSNQDYADFVYNFSQELELTEVTVVGQSFGGSIATIVAGENSDLVNQLVLVDANAHDKSISRVRFLNWFGDVFYFLSTKKLLPVSWRKSMVAFMSYSPSRELDDVQTAIISETLKRTHTEQMDERLEKVKAPTLLIWGNLDVKQPVSFAKKMQNHLENSKLITVFGGHTIMYKRPFQMAELIVGELGNKEK